MKNVRIDVKTASTKELVEFYNANAVSPVKKFRDRATAEARVTALLETLKPARPQVKVTKNKNKVSTLELVRNFIEHRKTFTIEDIADKFHLKPNSAGVYVSRVIGKNVENRLHFKRNGDKYTKEAA